MSTRGARAAAQLPWHALCTYANRSAKYAAHFRLFLPKLVKPNAAALAFLRGSGRPYAHRPAFYAHPRTL
jgi:hypothetical protein